MRIPCNRFVFWWNISIIKRRSTFTMLFLVAFVGGWLLGVAMGLSTATRVIKTHHSNLPYRPDIYDYRQEQTEPCLETWELNLDLTLPTPFKSFIISEGIR